MANDLLDTATADLFGADVADVPLIEANPAPILAGTAERNAHELNGSLKNVSGLGAAEGAEADCASLHPFGDVPDVPDVPPNNGAGSSGTAGGTADVPDVPALADLIEAATAGEGGDTEEAVVPSVPEDDRPCFKVYDGWTLLDTGRKLKPGVWLHGMTKPKREEMPVPVDSWVCGPLHIEAQTFDGSENNFGRLLRFKNTAGRWRSWAMPMELLKGDGSDLRGELLAMGLELDPFARQTLARYLLLTAVDSRTNPASTAGTAQHDLDLVSG